MLYILLFFIYFLFPGACILWLFRAKWTLIPELKPGGSIWLAIPTSFAISVNIVSVLGWIGFFLKLNFIEVKSVFQIILIVLFLASLVKFWQKRHVVLKALLVLSHKNHSYRNLEFVTAVFILIVLLLAIYGGTWFSHTADSFNHMAAVNSLIKYNNPVPMQIYWPDPVSGMDPTFGTWHLALAIWISAAGMSLPTMWLLATILTAPLIILAFIMLALELTQEKSVAFLAGLFYVIVGISGDFRLSAQPNRMGQIFLWLSIIFVIISIRTCLMSEDHSNRFYVILAAWFGWTSVTIHQQYPPALLGVIIPGLIFFYFLHHINQLDVVDQSNNGRKLVKSQIILTGIAVLLSTLLGFIIRSFYTISEKYPLVYESVQTILQTSPTTLILQDFSTWFSGWSSYISISSLFSIGLLYFLVRDKSIVKLGIIFIVISSILVPFFIILRILFIGPGGLVLSVFNRLMLLMPPILIIGWSWILVIVLRFFPIHLQDLSPKSIPTILLVDLSVILISLYSFSMRSIEPQGGIISLYSPQSSYKYRLRISRDSNLFQTRGNAIEIIRTIPDNARILADEGVGYEMAGITGKLFIRLPSQHTPLQEKSLNDEALQYYNDFVTGNLKNSQMVEILLMEDIEYVYIDRERYNGQILWDILPTIPVLEEYASDENWRLYQLVPERVEEFIAIDEKIRESEDFFESIAYMKSLEELFTDQKRYEMALQLYIPIKPAELMDFVNNGPNYTRPLKPGVIYEFLQYLDQAIVISSQTDTIKRTSFLIKRDARGVIYQHPPSRLVYHVDIPDDCYLDFSIALAPDIWNTSKGDGVDFIISIEKDAEQVNIFNRYINPKSRSADQRWLDFSIDLSSYVGQNVTIIFETRPGPKVDDRYDWAGWGEPRLRIDLQHILFKDWDYMIFQKESGR